MDYISHTNAAPWLIDPVYLVQFVESAMVAVVVVAGIGLVYGALCRLLSNRPDISHFPADKHIPSSRPNNIVTGLLWSLYSRATLPEGVDDEA